MQTDYLGTMDTLERVKSRLEILVGARVKERDKILRAMKAQNKLRATHSNLKKNWTGSQEIRKWREKR